MKNKPKTKQKKTANKRTLFMKPFFWIAMVLSCILIVSGVGLFRYHNKVQREKREFLEAQSKMEQLQNAFIKELGEPIYQSKEESCHYSQFGFSVTKGRLDCNFSFMSWFTVPDRRAAENRISTLQQTTQEKDLFTIWYQKPLTKDSFSDNDSAESTFKKLDPAVSHCAVHYYYITPDLLAKSWPSSRDKLSEYNTSNLLHIYGGCGSSPSQPIFPVTER